MVARSPRKGKSKFKVKNWSEYNRSLVHRGRIDFWIDESAIAQWHPEIETPKRGGQIGYSDISIQSCLIMRQLYRLPLRQTEGFVTSLIDMANLKIQCPDYTTISKRTSGLKSFYEKLKKIDRDKPITILVDSTGVKTYGEGEWKQEKHGEGKPTKWLKFHLGVNEENLEIEASILSDCHTSDVSQVIPLLEQIEEEIQDVKADGAYDYDSLVDSLKSFGIKGEGVFSPRIHFLSEDWKTNPTQRDLHLLRIAIDGRDVWEYASGYSKRNLVENAMFRYKNAFGTRLKSRNQKNQEVETEFRVHLLNQMTRLGMPKSERIR